MHGYVRCGVRTERTYKLTVRSTAEIQPRVPSPPPRGQRTSLSGTWKCTTAFRFADPVVGTPTTTHTHTHLSKNINKYDIFEYKLRLKIKTGRVVPAWGPEPEKGRKRRRGRTNTNTNTRIVVAPFCSSRFRTAW